jgi:hypothetical protein
MPTSQGHDELCLLYSHSTAQHLPLRPQSSSLLVPSATGFLLTDAKAHPEGQGLSWRSPAPIKDSLGSKGAQDAFRQREGAGVLCDLMIFFWGHILFNYFLLIFFCRFFFLWLPWSLHESSYSQYSLFEGDNNFNSVQKLYVLLLPHTWCYWWQSFSLYFCINSQFFVVIAVLNPFTFYTSVKMIKYRH